MTEIGGSPENNLENKNPQKIRFASFNCSGLAGKTHIIESLLTYHSLDFIFLSETWCRPGNTKRLNNNIIFSQETEIRSNGRSHYGQAIWINPARFSRAQYRLLTSDEENFTIIFMLGGTRFVCTYVPPSRPGEFFREQILKLSPMLFCPEPCILMGDLNARHTSFGDHAYNHYGQELLSCLPGLGLTRLEPLSGRWTFMTPTQRSIIDHILANDAAVSNNADLFIDEDFFVGSAEHCVLIGSVDGMLDDNLTENALPRPWNRWRLAEPEVVDLFLQDLNSTMDPMLQRMNAPRGDLSAQDHADRLYAHFDDWLTSALGRTVGRSSGAGRRPTEFLNQEILMKERNLQNARNVALSVNVPSERKFDLLLNYHECRRQLDSEIDARREELFRDFADRLQAMDPSAQMRVLHAMKRSKALASSSGLRTDSEAMNEYMTHFQTQYTNTLPSTFGPNLPEPFPIAEIVNSPFSLQSIQEAAKSLPGGKAAGNGGLPCEVLSVAHELVAFPLLFLFSFCWDNSVIPACWQESRIHPILKKGSATDIRNYRPISLTEVVRRLFEKMILPVITGFIEPLSIEQGGFRAKRGTLDQIATLQEWICQAKDQRLPRYMVFLDIKSAYDQVDREKLWMKCRKKGLPELLISLLRSLFDENKSCVTIAGARSSLFPLQSGLLQGSPISPVLYSLFIDDLVEELNGFVGTNALKLGGRLFRCLLYADDIVLLSTSWNDLCQLLNIAERHSLSNCYRFGVAKCESVLSATPSNYSDLRLYDEPIRCSTHFVYLGVPFSSDGILWKMHFESLGAKAQRTAGFFNSLGCNGRGFDTATCLRLYQCFVRPILEYGLALCPPSMVKLVDTFYGRCMRLMTSMGTTTSPLTLGMFKEIHPAKIRHATLQMKFAEKTRTKPIVFAVNYALSAFNTKATRNSCFKTWTSNDFISARDRERFRARLERRPPRVKNVTELQDDMLHSLLQTKSSCFIFRGRDRKKRKIFQRLFGKLNRVDQRLVLNWVSNRSVGSWKTCRRCGDSGASKHHLERCFWGETRRGFHGEGPSWIEEELAKVDAERNLMRCVDAIKELVGAYPADSRGTEPP